MGSGLRGVWREAGVSAAPAHRDSKRTPERGDAYSLWRVAGNALVAFPSKAREPTPVSGTLQTIPPTTRQESGMAMPHQNINRTHVAVPVAAVLRPALNRS